MRYGICWLVLVAAAAGCVHLPIKNNLPPAQQLAEPGPGVGGPGPGVMMYPPPPAPVPAPTAQVHFVGPEGMMVSWDISAPGVFDAEPLVMPGKYNFPQGAIYRLKLTNIPARPGVELYPTLEVGVAMPRTAAFLAHNAIPVEFTPEDFNQVIEAGNFVTKVIYLPDPEFQELAVAGVDTLVSTRLDPGVDPVVEAQRRGAIMAIVRLGNKDLQMPGVAGGALVPGGGPGGLGGPMGPGGLPCPAPGAVMPGAAVGGPTLPGPFVAGITAPQYGMPISGTPIGLPGPPHVPLGIPAGLQQHKIVNWTHMDIPDPTKKVLIDVKQRPGMSYPASPNYVHITEHTRKGLQHFSQPKAYEHQTIMGTDAAADAAPCPPGAAVGAPCPQVATP